MQFNNMINFSEDFEDCPSIEERIPEFWNEEQMKTRYFDIYVRYSEDSGFSVFLSVENLGVYDVEDIINIAINRKMIDSPDVEYINYVKEITAEDYLKAMS